MNMMFPNCPAFIFLYQFPKVKLTWTLLFFQRSNPPSLQQVTEKADVYDFGRFLLELLTGEDSFNITRFTIDKDSSLVAYIHNRAQGSCINEIVDPAILAEDGEGCASFEHQLQVVVDLALACTEEDPQRRPTMVDVTKQLRRIERFVPSLIIYSLDFIQSYVIDKQIHIIAYPNVLGMTTNKIYSLDFQTNGHGWNLEKLKKLI